MCDFSKYTQIQSKERERYSLFLKRRFVLFVTCSADNPLKVTRSIVFRFHSDVYGGRTGAEGSAHSTARPLRSAAEHPGIA